ncbi:MAG: NADH-ubiquinone oxidoreductase-F iron-sulfur binding region domain-containing protein [Bacteroidales bacterium]|nr:dehydrogenase [Bacteroidota bacterium]MDD2281559.1 NADH-ubiquinone oxidoreductase-F iron-sulfur binding region domain-containing protein [Bacteroidales bacterium]MDD4492058.1 NADH-ubiquinone oxidoreductase-F iron-sulfur binding region domain-containing protein [Bacteroidales bacterium]NTU94816.1 NADH-quinone oxidoreductase subunit E [Bacteroidales bacterium]NTV18250.1 NADH-quinone oxidoreductase subunit E [Bacteroidales bacterium]
MSTSYQLKRADFIFKNENDWEDVLRKSISRPPNELINELISSELKGRGGAGFPTGLKWKVTSEEVNDVKYVICNADEGEPGTFKDREILSRVPFKVLTAIAICGHVIGARTGFIYLRGEYFFLQNELNKAINEFEYYCKEIKFDFKIKIFMGSGAYICGEETALFESMEGKRGEPRNKPPYPSSFGYMGKPTVINNVETLAHTYTIFKYGSKRFYDLGVQYSRGSKLFSVSGDTPKPGIYELELGMSLADFVEEFGDDDTKAVQVGGASGFLVPRKRFAETNIGFQGKLVGISLPTGGSMMLFNSSRSMFNVLDNYLNFFAEESCGQCTPCRVGCQQLLKGIKAVKRGEKNAQYLDKMLKLAETMQFTAKCGLGQSVGNSFSSIVENFREEMIY